MGNKKNTLNSNKHRGKFMQRYRPNQKPIKKKEKVKGTIAKNSLTGCRIIDLQKLQVYTESVSKHSNVCSVGAITLSGTSNRYGLASILQAKCSTCGFEITFPTSSKVSGISGGKFWECNIAAVWGQMSIGGGHSNLEESMSVFGVPVMTKKSFMASEKRIGTWWMDILQQVMDTAGKEEREIATRNGSFNEGVPAITVFGMEDGVRGHTSILIMPNQVSG